MPLELGVWRIDQGLVALKATGLDLESRLQDLLDRDITIANPGWMVIGREVETGFDSRLDILAIDTVGDLIVIELKRDQTPREVVAQVLEYGAWVVKLRSEDIPQIYRKYVEKYHPERAAESFDTAFCRRFGVREVPEEINQSHELVVVASQFDATSERIVEYLADSHDVAINAVFFRVFKDGDREYLSRVWLRDPSEAESDSELRAPGQWNGEFYVSFGGGRSWEEARKYGYIGGGGGLFYSQTLHLLSPGDRVWVNVPGTGYVGVGHVEQAVVPIEQFEVSNSAGVRVPINSIPDLAIAKSTPSTADPEKAEYMVRVRWDKTVGLDKAFKERGFFGSQHTVARPKAEKWVHTVERLKTLFGITG
jgi:Endonuclease NucS